MSSIFGGGSEKSTATVTPAVVPVPGRPLRVSVSGSPRLNLAGGGFSADIARHAGADEIRNNLLFPSIRRQRSRTEGLINRLNSNENAFIRARVRPLEESLDRTLADRGRALSQRGVFGSLANNELDRTRTVGEREIADQRALATSDVINSLIQTETLQRGLTTDEEQITAQVVREELARLGIGLEALRLGAPDTAVAGGTTTSRASGGGSLLGGIGDLLSIGAALQGQPT